MSEEYGYQINLIDELQKALTPAWREIWRAQVGTGEKDEYGYDQAAPTAFFDNVGYEGAILKCKVIYNDAENVCKVKYFVQAIGIYPDVELKRVQLFVDRDYTAAIRIVQAGWVILAKEWKESINSERAVFETGKNRQRRMNY